MEQGNKNTSSENAGLLKLREYMKNSSKKEDHIPLEDFFKNSEIAGFTLSPNGKYLAYLKPFQKRMNIYIRKVDGSEPERRITNQTTRDITNFGWKENETLIFIRDFEGDENFHVFRVSATGENEKDLTPFKDTRVGVIDYLDDISEDTILIGSNQRDKTIFDAYRLNIKTGDIKMIAKNPGYFISWLTDHKGQLRVAFSIEGTDSSIYYRDTEEEEFQRVLTTNFKNDCDPVMFDFDDKNIFILSNLEKDKTAIELFDPKERKILSTLFSHPEVNVSGLMYSKKRKTLLAAHYITWKMEYHFFDSEYKKIFQELQLRVPKKEISIVSWNQEETLCVVVTYSDRNAGTYYLYDIKNKNLKKIADTRPWFKEDDLMEMKAINYSSRDGFDIHGYLTLPKGKDKNLPVVIHPHGGPWTRDVWGYNPTVQFLASRGYAVLQMNFRGSSGYGKKFWTAGFKQWGKKMQDDVTDGVQYLIEQGIADKDKVAVYGGSYGGYVVLAGLCFTPDLYACGVDYVGVSNIFTTLESIPPYWEPQREMMYEMHGHPEKDKELLKEVSPVFHADKIKSPLLVVQGAKDPRVKKAESDQIVEALESKGVEVPYLVKNDEGHGFRNEENRIEFHHLMEAFLQKHLH